MPATGKITQVIGSTFDAEFPEDSLPAIYNALHIDLKYTGYAGVLTGEVQQHLGGGKVRAVALGSTDGLRRGMDALDTGSPVTVAFNCPQRQEAVWVVISKPFGAPTSPTHPILRLVQAPPGRH